MKDSFFLAFDTTNQLVMCVAIRVKIKESILLLFARRLVMQVAGPNAAAATAQRMDIVTL